MSAPALYTNPAAATWQTSDIPDRHLAHAFHRTLPDFAPTQLQALPQAAQRLRVKRVLCKLETGRVGLSSFKILGASWGVFRAVCARLGLPVCSALGEVAGRARDARLALFTASQGNHGLAVSWMGRLLGVRVHVHVPCDAEASVFSELRQLGALVERSAGNYDVAVSESFAAAAVAADGDGDGGGCGIVVQDTAWAGYEEIPGWIVQGYGTLMAELDEQLGDERADIVVTPVGVGSLAEAVVRHSKSRGAGATARVLAVEPAAAGCLHASLREEKPVQVQTGSTILAGMNCGTLSSSAWPVLQAGVDYSITVTDAQAHERVERLYAAGLAVGPCGAAALAGLLRAEEQDRAALGLTSESVVVVICTEGPRPYVYEGVQYPKAAHSQDGQPDQRIILT